MLELGDEHRRHAVQRRAALRVTASSTLFGSKASPGKTIAAPCVTQPSTPMTMPKQWYSGTGMHRRSASVNVMRRATK